MIDATSNSADGITVSWSAPTSAFNISQPKRCKNTLCNRFTAFGSDYCSEHGPSSNPFDFGNTITQTRPRDTGPSTRELQRQLDRIEGKLDAVIAALGEEV